MGNYNKQVVRPHIVAQLSYLLFKNSWKTTNEVSVSRCFRNICVNSILTSWAWAKVKGNGTKRKPIHGFLYVYKWNEVSISRRFRDICENNILTSWPWTKVKGHGTKWKAIHGFLHDCDKNGVSYSRCSWDNWEKIRSKWVFGVQGATMHSTMYF